MAGGDPDLFSPALEILVGTNEIQIRDDRVYLTRLFKAEKGIADRLCALFSMPVTEYTISGDDILEQVLTGMAVKLSDEQLEVVGQVMAQKVSVITGKKAFILHKLLGFDTEQCTVERNLLYTALTDPGQTPGDHCGIFTDCSHRI